MRKTYRNYTIDQFKQAIMTSPSIAQALTKLGLAPEGGNYRVVRKAVAELGLDTSHMTGQLWNKGKSCGPKRPLKDYLENKFTITSHKLRLRLLSEKVMEHRCAKCENIEWLGNPIPLELEHKNGNHEDNTLSNLELLCPNCHTLTETYRGKKKKCK